MSSAMHTATLVSLFSESVRSGADQVAMHIRRGTQFESLTWHQFGSDVRRFAMSLVELGVRPGDRVVQVSENRYEWILCDQAVHLVRGVHVAVHCSLTGPQIAYQICDSGARLVIVSGPEQAAKLSAVATELPPGLRFVSLDACEHPIGKQDVVPLSSILDRIGDNPPASLDEQALAVVRPDDLATILYTSGTTGEPKGVMLSHGNLASNAIASLEAFGGYPEDVRLSWLPLSHIFARTSDLYTWLACGSQFGLAVSRETILDDCAALRPTLINGVPYFYDKLMRILQERGEADTPGSLQRLLGGRIRMCCAGGAALPNHVAEFFWRQGVPLVQGYGLTESSPVISVGNLANNRIGTVGPAISGVEVRIAADGEVLTRGPHVMLGYWNKPEATAEVLRDGWLYTGDLGRLDDDGYLSITGRKKELIVTASGKNIAPVYLECLLSEDPLISQVMVIGDGRNYLTALVVPDRDRLRSEIIARGIPVTSAAEALVHPAVRQLYSDCIARRLADVSPIEQVRKFTLLGRGFSIESGEMTPTLKLRRSVIAQSFASEIDAMYREPCATD